MDPQLRILLEITYETIVDAGFNPVELGGSRTGVFVGASYSENICEEDSEKSNEYALPSMSMFADRLSSTFDFKGQSYVINTGCSSSMFALTQAVDAIRNGYCDAAIVAGTSLCLSPLGSIGLQRLGVLSPEGRCAVFDASASVYVRRQAVVAVLLQLRGAARRVYATVRGAHCNNDGNKEQGITISCGEMQRQLAQETFQMAGIRPQDVTYIEAHGIDTKVRDTQEVNGIAELFCKDRQKPLLLGSVKSNMGHPEPDAGLCFIVKVMIAMQNGVIPGNLHYHFPNPDIPALSDDRMQVVSRNTLWAGALVAVNSIGFGGTNAHVILEPENSLLAAAVAGDIAGPPRLVLASGRTEEAVRALLQHAEAHRDSAALHALLDAVHALPIPGHTHRGYRLLDDPPQEEIQETEDGGSSETRPMWFVFSGMGSQCPGVARSLLALPVFAASIARSAQVLEPYGFDLQRVLTEVDEKVLEDVTNSFVSITAIQVALVDLLREVGITPDGIVGISVGEIGCAYADGALTAEQAVLSAYWRGRAVADAKVPPGIMKTVGLTWEEAQKRCPADIAVACHIADNLVTLAGPVQSVERFVAELTAEEIFAQHVSTCGVAFHSKYVAAAAPLLRARLETVIPRPKPRSIRWVTTSLPEEQWSSPLAKLSSAEYFVNNLVSPVRLARALRAVPARAAVVEVAPHAMLAPMLRRILPRAAHAPLLCRPAVNAVRHLLAALGKLFVAGRQPRVGRLYPPVPWSVPRGTPGLASHVRWYHGVRWNVAKFGAPQRF